MKRFAELDSALAEAPSLAAARSALVGTEAWVVGGAIRDALLERPVGDADLVVAAGAEERTARVLAESVSGHVFPLSREHGTWRAIAPDDGWHVDVASLRAETIEEDLALRDFTVNAIAVPLEGGDPLDPTGGLPDADRGVLRVTGEGAFDEDPLRLLRAARIGAGYELEPEPGTVALARGRAGRAAEPAGERQFAELRLLVGGPRPLRGLELLDRLGILEPVLPELWELKGVEQNPNHHLDVYGHTVAVLGEWLRIEDDLAELAGGELADPLAAFLGEPLADELTRGQALRFGALLHDVGKPDTRGERGGYVTFIGHDELGALMVASVCRRFRTSRRLSTHLQALTMHHLRLGFLVHERPLSRRAVYGYLSATDPVGADVTLLSAADRLAARGTGPLAAPEVVQAHLELAREMLAEALAWHRDGPPDPPLDGDELSAELGLAPGPELGRLLEELRAARFAGEIRDRDEAVELARRLAAGRE